MVQGARVLGWGLVLGLACAGLAGCASGAGDPADDGAQVNNDAPQPQDDAGDDSPPDTGTPDTGSPDTGQDADPVEDEPEPECGVCCPGTRRCFSDTVAEVCNAQGSAFDPDPCGAGLVCQGGSCRQPEFSCTPGQTSCLDLTTQQTCDAGGRSLTSIQCQGGLCLDGACRVGAPTASACAADAECAGGRCLCDADDECGPALQESFGQGYCTLADCATTGCLAGEVCVDLSLSGGLSEGHHCVKGCDGCMGPGFECRPVPTIEDDAVAWGEACFPAVPAQIGGRCANDGECLGGTCWRDELGPNDGLGYCTMAACDMSRGCPEGSSCVEFPGLGFFCGRHCGNGDAGSGTCPEDRGLALTCKNLAEVGGRRLRFICAPRL